MLGLWEARPLQRELGKCSICNMFLQGRNHHLMFASPLLEATSYSAIISKICYYFQNNNNIYQKIIIIIIIFQRQGSKTPLPGKHACMHPVAWMQCMYPIACKQCMHQSQITDKEHSHAFNADPLMHFCFSPHFSSLSTKPPKTPPYSAFGTCLQPFWWGKPAQGPCACVLCKLYGNSCYGSRHLGSGTLGAAILAQECWVQPFWKPSRPLVVGALLRLWREVHWEMLHGGAARLIICHNNKKGGQGPPKM